MTKWQIFKTFVNPACHKIFILQIILNLIQTQMYNFIKILKSTDKY